MLESMMVVANRASAPETRRRATPRIDPGLRLARTCYDHLAGQLGVGIADRLIAQDVLVLGDEAGELTESGRLWLERFGITTAPLGRTRRLFCRPCLDWSERRPHLAGRLGAALCRRCKLAQPDYSRRPYCTVRTLQKLRNDVAHPKTKRASGIIEVSAAATRGLDLS